MCPIQCLLHAHLLCRCLFTQMSPSPGWCSWGQICHRWFSCAPGARAVSTRVFGKYWECRGKVRGLTSIQGVEAVEVMLPGLQNRALRQRAALAQLRIPSLPPQRKRGAVRGWWLWSHSLIFPFFPVWAANSPPFKNNNPKISLFNFENVCCNLSLVYIEK